MSVASNPRLQALTPLWTSFTAHTSSYSRLHDGRRAMEQMLRRIDMKENMLDAYVRLAHTIG